MKTKKEKIQPYTPMLNSIAQNPKLTFQAKGALLLMQSRPPGWEINVQNLINNSGGASRQFVRKTLKELVDAGLVKRVVQRNPKNNQFNGTRYVLNNSACRVFPISERPRVENPDCRETVLPINTENKKERKLNNNEHQQTGNQSAAVVGNDISFFFSKLLEDTAWRSHFETQLLGDTPLGRERMALLLLSFKQSSLKRNGTYKDENAVKNHFSNWFSKISERDLLLFKISRQKKMQQILTQRASQTVGEINNVFHRYTASSFEDVPQVEYVIRELPNKLELLKSTKNSLVDEKILANVKRAIVNAEKLRTELETGKRESKLHLICKPNSNNT